MSKTKPAISKGGIDLMLAISERVSMKLSEVLDQIIQDEIDLDGDVSRGILVVATAKAFGENLVGLTLGFKPEPMPPSVLQSLINTVRHGAEDLHEYYAENPDVLVSL